MSSWVPPRYDTARPPVLIYAGKPVHDPEFAQIFSRTAKWSPDGSTVLCQCENRTFQRLDLPRELLASDLSSATSDLNSSHQTFHQPSPILDFAWFPRATSSDPSSFCFVASVRECPVKLFDASDGRLRASYKIVDHRERQIAPHSLAFNLMANKLYCGFEDAIEVFDVHSPGEGTRLATTPSKKSKDGLKGIISALTFSPSYDFYAAGSLAQSTSNIALLSESEDSKPVMFISTEMRAGVTQLHFNPTKPHILYASFRRHDAIHSWDLRGNVGTPVQVFRRAGIGNNVESGTGDGAKSSSLDTRREMSNQKMKFDVDLSGKWLGVGDQNGDITVFNLDLGTVAETDFDVDDLERTTEVSPTLRYNAHGDAIGSVAFHPLHPLILSVSGSRHFLDDPDTSGSSSSLSDGEEEREEQTFNRNRTKPHPITLDNSIKVWRFNGSDRGLALSVPPATTITQ